MFKNLEGQKFGRLVAVKKVTSQFTSGGNVKANWLCKCACGKEKVVMACSLTGGKVKSCGCWLIDSAKEKGYKNATHGHYSQFSSADERIKFESLINIRERSKVQGYETDLELEDLPVLTAKCPVFGAVYKKGSLKDKNFVPTIDRINSNLPYLKKHKDNLVFISHRANRIKKNASVEEIQKVIEYILWGRSLDTTKNRFENFDFNALIRSVKNRSNRRGYSSDLSVDDLPTLTDTCPVLGLKYQTGRGGWRAESPTLDRRNPNLPYLKKYRDNLAFMSWRANEIKSDATVEELQSIVQYMRSHQERESLLIDSKPIEF
jgi:hypothetical protein